MKYIFLTGAVVFGIVGICEAMDAIKSAGGSFIMPSQIIINFQTLSITFQPLPGFIRIFILSFLFTALFLTLRRLKQLGIGKIWEYIPC